MDFLRKENKYLLLFLLFILSFTVHMIGLNLIGRTWDEQFKVDMGHIALDRLGAGDLSVSSWNFGTEHPMIAKYVYGFFLGSEMIRIDNGAGGQAILSPWDQEELAQSNFIITILYDKAYAIMYDFTFPRVVSAIFNSLAVILTTLIGFRLLGYRWGWLPSILLLLMPRFVVMGQLITYESLSVFLWCGTILIWDTYMHKPKKVAYLVYLGILCGLLFWTRYNNVFIFVFLSGLFLIHYAYFRPKKPFTWKLIFIPVISFLVGFLTWPLLWQEFPKFLISTFSQHNTRGIGPSFYFLEYLIITTPLPILIGGIVGIVMSLRERTYWQVIFLWWFFSTLIFFSLLSVPIGGTRYIYVLYPALAILASYGYSVLLRKKLLYALIPIVLFLIWEMSSVFPYYLDYYNQLVGGPSGAAKRGYDFSWWGEGQREVGMWMNQHVPQGKSVGLIVTPKYVFPLLRQDLLVKGYVTASSEAEYIVVSRYDKTSLPKDFIGTHKLVYQAQVDHEPLVELYIRK